MTAIFDLRADAETLGQSLPPLLAEAESLTSTIILGEHGRRRAGQGDEFWQYRPAHTGDSARMIDWRRSARSDTTFVREREWQATQSVTLWVDTSRAMSFASKGTTKADRARLLALATAVLLLRGGERVGLSGYDMPPRSGKAQLLSLTQALTTLNTDVDYGTPDTTGINDHGRCLFLSDFLGDLTGVEKALAHASDHGAKGVLMQVLDPTEEQFPFNGRTIFESMRGSLSHETLRASDLRARYLDRLAERKDRLQTLTRAVGWHFTTHNTGEAPLPALLCLFHAIEGGR
ncbi:MAG: DUF58 domain-containing protein [Rhodobacteraceae bacterium]|nr:DUF58 domain-containing protein [Paracoccaceae bacterium]